MSDALNIAGAIALGIIIAAFAIAMFVGLPQMRAEWKAWRVRRRLAKALEEEVIIWPQHPPEEEVREVLDTAAISILENTQLREALTTTLAELETANRRRARHWRTVQRQRKLIEALQEELEEANV